MWLALALCPVLALAQAVIDPVPYPGGSAFYSTAGFIHGGGCFDLSGNGNNLVFSNGVTVGNSIRCPGTNAAQVRTAANGATNNIISMALINAPGITVIMPFRVRSLNNGSQYNNLLANICINNPGLAGVWISITSNKFLVGGRSNGGEPFRETISGAITMSNTWVVGGFVHDFRGGSTAIYANGIRIGGGTVAWSGTSYVPVPVSGAANSDWLMGDGATAARAINGDFLPPLVMGRAMPPAEIQYWSDAMMGQLPQ